jgi:formylglycine-generating enzyme required for sulfatase activity
LRFVGIVGSVLLGLVLAQHPPVSGFQQAQTPPVAGTAQAAYTERVPGTNVTFEMVPIAGGTFEMGSPDGEAGRDQDEGPRHSVTVGPFWMGKYEVTWDEYDRFAFGNVEPPATGAAAAKGVDAVTRPTPPYGDESFGFGKGRQPVINVTHHAAMEYTRWLSQVTGKAYRLPTEAEWEFAARAGSPDAYSFGRDAKGLDAYAWYAANAEDRPHPVGAKKPNAFGLFDMYGNVAEWCLDQYAPDFYSRSAGRAPVLLPSDRRYPDAVRGGSWADEPKELRSAARRASTESWSRRDPQSPQSIWWHTDATIVGFRVVRAVEEEPSLRGVRSKVTRDSPNR